ILKPESGRSKLPYVVFGRAHVKGNIVEGNEQVTQDNWNGGIQVEGKDGELMSFEKAKPYFAAMKVDKPMPMAPITILPTMQAYNFVLNNAGASLPKRDPVDVRVIEQVRTGKIVTPKNVKLPKTQFEHRRLPIDSYKGGIITDISQVGGYPEYKGTPYKDSDNDGMPDDWEAKNGLNPKDATDASTDKNGDGYTNIEDYLNSVVEVANVKP
ncbi:MAG: thrombospondin type 3 repeat-containing protein, partial [Sphingobacteriaceae bacterium]